MDSTIAILSEDQYDLVYNALSFGTAVMLGAFVYFLTQMSAVNKEYRPAVAASAVVVGIAGYHYLRIWQASENGEMNEGYRYADWLITVPLLVIELLIVLGVASDQRTASSRRQAAHDQERHHGVADSGDRSPT